jgi:hypothetical protein
MIIERDGTCQVGDMIIAVDDREVMGEPLSALRNLILGNQGPQGECRISSSILALLEP